MGRIAGSAGGCSMEWSVCEGYRDNLSSVCYVGFTEYKECSMTWLLVKDNLAYRAV